jgi:hypothetical protein
MMPRTALVVASGLALATSPLSAQAHEAHRHPRGGKIILVGTLVDPVCAFAQQLTDSAQARCSGQHADDSFEPALSPTRTSCTSWRLILGPAVDRLRCTP